jgi:hypothetical protein
METHRHDVSSLTIYIENITSVQKLHCLKFKGQHKNWNQS